MAGISQKANFLESVELFAGAGGLALGFSENNVHHQAVVEWNKHACETIKNNKRLGVEPVAGWGDVVEGDVSNFSYEKFKNLDLVTGGPPCQPFSMGGKHQGFLDVRDMFPQAVRAIREVQPKAFVFENVKGLTRSNFYSYFSYILLQLEFPSLRSKPKEEWINHRARLEKYKTKGNKPEYHVLARLVNAANYGIPQKRERVFIVGFRADVHRSWTFPIETHSHESLLHSQWVTEEYWDRHGISKRQRPLKTEALEKKIQKLAVLDPSEMLLPWKTVRDAIIDLPDPEKKSNQKVIQAHRFISGARIYPGHTGSPLDEPAKALKAGDHGVPGGENMLRRPDGSVRYFTVRECARLQTFPDQYVFEGSWGETMRQLGNAVPVKLASQVAASVCSILRKK